MPQPLGGAAWGVSLCTEFSLYHVGKCSGGQLYSKHDSNSSPASEESGVERLRVLLSLDSGAPQRVGASTGRRDSEVRVESDRRHGMMAHRHSTNQAEGLPVRTRHLSGETEIVRAAGDSGKKLCG
ncbi:MAG: hypothetical protein JNL10_21225 [Verrucomicrobiales bacterium]|nr:hypothetical protein [Verrucomicrobiales bacterium]